MRVLLINRNDFVDGGADRVFLNTVEMLQEGCDGYDSCDSYYGCDRNNHNYQNNHNTHNLLLSTFTRHDAGLDNMPDPRTLSFLGKLKTAGSYLFNKQVARELDKKIKEFKPDIAHVHLIFGTLSGSVLRVLKRHRIPVAMTLHDYRLICPANAMLDRHGNVCEKCRGSRYYKCLIHRCSEGNVFFSVVIMLEAYLRKWFFKPVKNIDRFIFVSEFARDKHIGFDKRYAGKSSLLYNMAEEKPETEPFRGDYLLYFGRLSKEKGLLTLFEAVKGLEVKLRIAGSGPQEEELRRQETRDERPRDQETERPRDRETLNIRQPTTDNRQPITYNNHNTHNTHNPQLLGYRTGTDLEQLIRHCSFVVLPSEWYENNPMSVVESFALGKPVIASQIGGIPELVTADTGFLFESGSPESLKEAIEKAACLPDDEYRKMSINCRTFALKNFNREQHLQQLMHIYKLAIDRA